MGQGSWCRLFPLWVCSILVCDHLNFHVALRYSARLIVYCREGRPTLRFALVIKATLSEHCDWVVLGVLILVFGLLVASLQVLIWRNSLLFLVMSRPLLSTLALTTCPAACWAFLLSTIF